MDGKGAEKIILKIASVTPRLQMVRQTNLLLFKLWIQVQNIFTMLALSIPVKSLAKPRGYWDVGPAHQYKSDRMQIVLNTLEYPLCRSRGGRPPWAKRYLKDYAITHMRKIHSVGPRIFICFGSQIKHGKSGIKPRFLDVFSISFTFGFGFGVLVQKSYVFRVENQLSGFGYQIPKAKSSLKGKKDFTWVLIGFGMCTLFPKYHGKSQRSLGRDFPFGISDPNPDSRFSTPNMQAKIQMQKWFTAGFAALVLCAKTRSNPPKYLTPRKYESITAVKGLAK
ncbi:hypothetical protein ARMGADRAFT_1038249 [Armillaria gallica]|uniref:Uncharacterized protein n=1 Tax=Armillaria gallica TaxID=47427 RepID=A0A2H3CIN5_ARMGA|nr:hypothetical protein ARMGADRAFT_1038249 [Armillaria gallica]